MKNLKVEFAKIMYALASTTKTEVNDFMLELYLSELEPLGLERVNQVLIDFFKEALTRMPAINTVKDRLGLKEMSEEEIARDAIQRIRSSVSRFGYVNWAEAKEFIGAVGVHIVSMMGGWEAVCSAESFKELDFALTQAREYAKVAVRKAKIGELETPIPFSGRLTDHNPREFIKLVPKK